METDDLFSRTLQLLKDFNAPQERFLQQLTRLYQEKTGITPEVDKKTNIIFLETFSSNIKLENINDIGELLTVKNYIVGKVKENAEEMYFFSQPVVFLIYWLIETIGADSVCANWPLPGYIQSLKLICSDLNKHPRYEHF